MNQDDITDKLVDYLYGDISSAEKAAFKKELESDPELTRELKNYIQLREIVHEHLPNRPAPKHLTKKVLTELGVRKPWFEIFAHGWSRPALAGVFVLVLTLGITYGWKRLNPPHTQQPSVAHLASPPTPMEAPTGFATSETDIADRLLAQKVPAPRLRMPVRISPATPMYGGRGGAISLVGLNSPSMPEPDPGIPQAEIHRLDFEAQNAVAQFIHQQAMRMRAVGDFKGAAEQLAYLLKTYPFYPLKLQVMAQRVDCLFRSGELALAKKELKVLNELSPTLAYLVERRWRN